MIYKPDLDFAPRRAFFIELIELIRYNRIIWSYLVLLRGIHIISRI